MTAMDVPATVSFGQLPFITAMYGLTRHIVPTHVTNAPDPVNGTAWNALQIRTENRMDPVNVTLTTGE